MGVVAPVKPVQSDAAEWVKQTLPVCAEFASALRNEFPETRLTYASEQSHVIGKPAEPPAFTVTGDALMESLRKKVKK